MSVQQPASTDYLNSPSHSLLHRVIGVDSDAPVKTIQVASTGLTIGTGVAAIDYKITFDGQTNDGIITWMEDEDYFRFSDDVLMNSTEAIYFRDTDIHIKSVDDGHLDLTANTSIDLNANVVIGANSFTVNSVEIVGSDGEVNKAAVEDSTNWDAAYTHVSNNGSDHSFIDQSVVSGSAPTFTANNFSDGGNNAIITTTQETNFEDAYTKRVDTWGDGLTYSSQTASIDYNSTNLQITANQINTIQDIASSSSPTFTNLTLSGASILANASASGILTLGGTGSTNNENLTLDFESVANSVLISTGTGVTGTDWNTDFFVGGRFGEGNRTLPAAGTDHRLRVYSDDTTQNNDYIEMYMNQTNPVINWSNGSLNLAGGNVGIGTEYPQSILHIHVPSGTNPTTYWSDGDVSHGMTSLAPTNVLGKIGTNSSLGGGMRFSGYTDANNTAFAIHGYFGAEPSDDIPAIVFQGYKKDGNSAQALSNPETILGINNAGGTNLMVVLGGGNIGINTIAPNTRTEINLGTSDKVRLSYNAPSGSATDYTEMGVDSNGGLTITTVDGDGTSGDITLSPDGLIKVTTDMIFSGAGSGLPYGEIYYHGAGTNLAMAAQDTYYQFTGFDSDGEENLTDADHTNDHIEVQKTGMYLVNLSITARAATAEDWEVAIFRNNGASICTCADIHFTTIAGGKGVPSGTSALLSCSADDTVEVWAKRTTGGAASKTLIFDHAVMNVVQIGG